MYRPGADLTLLESYCKTWARWREAESAIDKTGTLVRKAGSVAENPLIRIAARASTEVRRLEKQLGIDQVTGESDSDAGRANPLVVGRADLARLMGKTPNEISKLLDEGLPALAAGKKGAKSRYDAVAVMAWWRTREVKEDAVERARYFQLQGDKLEQEIRARAGQLVEVSETEKAWALIVIACKERMLSIPGAALQLQIVNDDGEEVLIGLVDEALRDVSR